MTTAPTPPNPRDYSERQLVVVAPDHVVTATRAAEARAQESRSKTPWTEIGETALAALRSALTPIALVDLTVLAVEAWANARQKGLNVLQISRSEAASLTFPPGHPRDGVLYIGHPALPNVYYTASTFHRMAFEHKFAEAIELLMHLGATNIKAEHIRGWSREFAARVSVALPPLETDVKAHATEYAGAQANLLYEANLRGHGQAALPESLVWYPHEPTWQAIAQGRLRFGLSDFSLVVNYEDDFGIDVGLGTAARRSGLELGGTFEGHEATTWRLSGRFAGG